MNTPIGLLPTKEALDTSGLDLTDDQLQLLLSVDPTVWREEAALIPQHYREFGEHLPPALWNEYEELTRRLAAAEQAAASAGS